MSELALQQKAYFDKFSGDNFYATESATLITKQPLALYGDALSVQEREHLASNELVIASIGKYADLKEAFDTLKVRCDYLERRCIKKDRKRSAARKRNEELEMIYQTEVQESL